MNILAMDFGGSSVKYSIVDEMGNCRNHGKLPAPLTSKEEFVNCILQCYQNCEQPIDGVAVSMPGYINSATGQIAAAGCYQKMANQNLYVLIKEKMDIKVSVQNDGKCAALAEAWKGSLASTQEGAVLIIGSGLAGGLIHQGNLFAGHSLKAGEFSMIGIAPERGAFHFPVADATMPVITLKAASALGINLKKCPYYGLNAIYQIPQGELSNLDNDPRFENGIDGMMFFELLHEGNPEIAKIYDEFLTAVCSVLMTIQTVYDPEAIAVGGAVFHQECLFPDLKEKVSLFDSMMGGALPHIELRACSASDNSNEIGAVYNYLQKYYNK